MMLYENTKIKFRSPDVDAENFDIEAGVLHRDTLATYLLFFFCLDYMLWTLIDLMKENGFKLTKERNRRYPAQTISDADYADKMALLGNSPTQAESLLHSLEHTAGSIGLQVNSDKTKYMCFNQRYDVSTLKGCPLKLVEKFTYLGSSVS